MSKLPKLVRDKIPNIIRESGSDAVWKTASSAQWMRRDLLIRKLREETAEFEDLTLSWELPDSAALREEAADMLECCLALWRVYGIELDEVVRVADAKRRKRGGFDDGIILEAVITKSDDL